MSGLPAHHRGGTVPDGLSKRRTGLPVIAALTAKKLVPPLMSCLPSGVMAKALAPGVGMVRSKLPLAASQTLMASVRVKTCLLSELQATALAGVFSVWTTVSAAAVTMVFLFGPAVRMFSLRGPHAPT